MAPAGSAGAFFTLAAPGLRGKGQFVLHPPMPPSGAEEERTGRGEASAVPRQRGDGEPFREHGRVGGDRGQRPSGRCLCRGRPESCRVSPVTVGKGREHLGDGDGGRGECAEPAAHRGRGTAQPGRDPPVPVARGGFGFNGGGDHRSRIGPARSQPGFKQHMGSSASGASSAARTMAHQEPSCPGSVADQPFPRPAPRTQPAPAPRALQETPRQIRLDRDTIMIYREHRRALYASERPGVNLENSRRAVRCIRSSSA